MSSGGARKGSGRKPRVRSSPFRNAISGRISDEAMRIYLAWDDKAAMLDEAIRRFHPVVTPDRIEHLDDGRIIVHRTMP